MGERVESLEVRGGRQGGSWRPVAAWIALAFCAGFALATPLYPPNLSSDSIVRLALRSTDGAVAPPETVWTSSTQGAAPRNVILMIADGMGLSHVAGARATHPFPLWLDRLPVTGIQTTHSFGMGVTDSAAAATAMATGHKTRNGAVGVDAWERSLPTVIDTARNTERAIGIVTDSYLWDATPAAFLAHARSRTEAASILAQMAQERARVMIGSSLGPGLSEDGESVDPHRPFRDLGAVVTTDWSRFRPREIGNLVALLPGLGDRRAGTRPVLSELSERALEALTTTSDPFFLLIETEQIDSRSHRNDFDGAVRGVLEFDEAVGAILEFARLDGETLVVVTSDHETGGPSLTQSRDRSSLRVLWASKGHTAAPVPILAYGPGSDKFAGTIDNTDIALLLNRLLSPHGNF